MRLFCWAAALAISWALAVSLATSSPFAAGSAGHRDQLLDAIYPHPHPGQSDAPVPHSDTPGPVAPDTSTIGASAGAVGVGLLSITTSGDTTRPLIRHVTRTLPAARINLPAEVRFAPPDPPPTRSA